MNKMKQNNQKGFTLIELLVVIAIIGLLASVVLLALNSARVKARDAKRIADVRQLASAQELYSNDNSGSYATSAAALVTGNYIGTVPSAPTGGSCSSTSYTFTGGGTAAYDIGFCLEQTTAGYGPGTHSITPSGIQ